MKNVYVDEMEITDIKFTDEMGMEHAVPVVGVFTVDGNHYVVVLVESEETKEQELLLLKALRDLRGDYVQIIDNKEEWIKASEAWHAITNKVDKGELRTLEG